VVKHPKSAIACLAVVVTTALMPSGALAAGRMAPMPGTYRWPPYAEGGNMPRTTCGYVQVNPYPYKHRQGGRVYRCR